jgi:hypothetical protein
LSRILIRKMQMKKGLREEAIREEKRKEYIYGTI